LTPALPVDSPGRTVGPPPKPQGTFTITGLFPDRYWLNARARPGLYIKSVRLGPEDVMGRPFDLTAANSGTLHIIVSANAGAISGIVKGVSGTPLPQARVVLIPDSVMRASVSGFYDAIATINSSLADQNGRYGFATLAPGNYRVFAWASPADSDWSDRDALKTVEEGGSLVKVEEGITITLDLKAIPGR
jgi:hypothetical protein